MSVLAEHEHVIDCIVWAPNESCKTIDAANYAAGLITGEEAVDENGEPLPPQNSEEGGEDGP